MEVVEDDKVYTLRAGDFVCHAPMEFHRIFRYIHSEEKEPYYGAEAAFAAASFLMRLSRRTTSQERISGERGAAEYRRLIGTMQTFVRKNLTLPEIVEKMNFSSPNYLKLFFKTNLVCQLEDSRKSRNDLQTEQEDNT